MDNETIPFQNAGEIKESVHEKLLFETHATFNKVFNRTLELATLHRKEGQNLYVNVTVEDITASFKVESPSARGGSYRKQAPRKVTKQQIEQAITEWQDSLIIQETEQFYFVKAKGRLGDLFDAINQKLRGIGMRYVRWENKEYTGGWKGTR